MNNFEHFSKPILIEPGTKYFLNETLKKCHIFKENYKNILFNVVLFISFLLILAIILIVKYKGKLTLEQMKEKELEKKKYILLKIKNYQDSRRREEQELISGLPHWDNEY